jgi:hypothetical protein
VLRHDFAEHELFAEILRAHTNARVVTTGSQQRRRHYHGPLSRAREQAFAC